VAAPAAKDKPGDRRVPMTNLRARIAERLVQAQHTAAILTPPQAGILGMHKIQDRAMVIEGADKKKTIEIRPMMYLALSYDHRLIDGKGAVTFLVTIKDLLEHPEKLKLDF
jgi:pyruvate/2-oxoglutarate dehydrogenase complex dihydrolipoamide acyltransferase (E2) component